jgi:hypothetical protein
VLKVEDGGEYSVLGYTYPTDVKKIFVLIDAKHFLYDYERSTREVVDTLKHEIRHWYHHMQFPNIKVGLPSLKIRNKKGNVFSLLGLDKSDTPHHLVDAEFKPNVHTYAYYIEEYLNKYVSKSNWKKVFRNIITGKHIMKHSKAPNETPMINYIVSTLGDMMNVDRLRWKQMVKEIYILIFDKNR